MWNRRELKRNAKKTLKKNYFAIIAVCFIIAFFGGEFSSTTNFIYQYNSDNELTQYSARLTNSDAIHGFLKIILSPVGDKTRDEIFKNIDEFADTTIDKYTRPIDWVFKFIHGSNSILGGNVQRGVTFIIIGFLAILIRIFVLDILVVGEKRFFLETRKYPKTHISTICFLYEQRKILRPAITMAVKGILTWLWWLTIVGGVIKFYEYRMIPFIVAENPDIDRKKAFRLSKEMMRGQKWNTFKLDVSFFGWILLQTATLGFLAIFFVNPYYSAVNAELYITLRKNAIVAKMPYSEELNDTYL